MFDSRFLGMEVPKRLIFVGLALLMATGVAWIWVPWLATPNPEVSDRLVNRNEPVDYRVVPPAYESLSDAVMRKPLRVDHLGSRQPMRFDLVTDSGIEFKNFFDRSKPYELLDTGSGIAIGDYDNDGLQDVYMVGGDTANRLFRNLGGFKFEDVTQTAGVDGQYRGRNLLGAGASFADVDNDGDLDLYVCNMASPNMLFINQGDGTFDEQAFDRQVAHVGASKIGNFCDYDRDGDLDLYLVTYQDRKPDSTIDPVIVVDGKKQIREDLRDQFALAGDGIVKAGQQDVLFRNDGKGVFEDVTAAAGLVDFGTTLAAVWFDYDDDGWQDIYASNDFHAPDRLFRNNGDGTFSDVLPELVKHTPWFSMGSDTGDLNNDGFLDFMTADMSGTSHYKRKVDMGDMGDSAFFLEYGRPRQYMKNCLFINSGMGPFFEVASMAGVTSTDWTWAIRLVDIDNDGKLDIFATNGHARDMMNADISNKFAALGERNATPEEMNEFYCQIPAKKEANLAFRNLGDLAFEKTGSEWNVDHVGVSHGAAFADLDGDGDSDLVVNNYYEPSLVYRNESPSGSRTLMEFRCQDNNFFGLGTKVEIWQDGQYQMRTLNPVRGYLSSDPPLLHFGSESSAPIELVKVTWPDRTTQEFKNLEPNFLYRFIESPDRNAVPSKKPQPTLFNETSARFKLEFRHQEKRFDDFERENLLPYRLSELGAGLAWGDVNGDSLPDLFCGGAAGQSGVLYINHDGSSFEQVPGPWKQDVECEDMGVIFFDADGDGDDDLYVVSGSNECEPGDPVLKDRLYLNEGGESFVKSPDGTLPDLADSGSCVVADDFDHDGDLDLFVGSRAIPGKYPLTPISRLLRNDGGKFSDATETLAASLAEVGLVNGAVWSDYDLDGWNDLVIALDWGAVTVFKNEQGKLTDVTSELKLGNHKGWWRGISAADLDDDGDLDFVVTNQGQNTKYHADFEHPHRLYYSDFDNSGTLDLVETEIEGGVEYPARGLSCSSNSMPFIAEKFETYHEFATASLSEIYEPSIREKPFREVNFLDSAILWNEGDQGFQVQSLPRMAQVSPAFGISINDFDGDSKLDIFLANNFFASQPETGFMDGGLSLLLTGRSDRKFEVQWPNQSGVVLNAASYGSAMADIDADGDLDIAVSANNDRLKLLENVTAGQAPVKIELVGGPKNFRAIGARLNLRGKGFQRALQVSGGDGYLSQSSTGALTIPAAMAQDLEQIDVAWPDGTKSTHAFQLPESGPFRIQKD